MLLFKEKSLRIDGCFQKLQYEAQEREEKLSFCGYDGFDHGYSY